MLRTGSLHSAMPSGSPHHRDTHHLERISVGEVEGSRPGPPALQKLITFLDLLDPKSELTFKNVFHVKISDTFLLAARGQPGWPSSSSSSFQWKRALSCRQAGGPNSTSCLTGPSVDHHSTPHRPYAFPPSVRPSRIFVTCLPAFLSLSFNTCLPLFLLHTSSLPPTPVCLSD